MTPKRLRLVIFQQAPGSWRVRGLEHDLSAEACSIGEAVRAAMRFVEVHTAFDIRHDLSAFPPAAQPYWNAYATGTPIPVAQLGVTPPLEWNVQAAFATCHPREAHAIRAASASPR
jgi:hypothetical protein